MAYDYKKENFTGINLKEAGRQKFNTKSAAQTTANEFIILLNEKS
jgi:hypothetical protein